MPAEPVRFILCSVRLPSQTLSQTKRRECLFLEIAWKYSSCHWCQTTTQNEVPLPLGTCLIFILHWKRTLPSDWQAIIARSVTPLNFPSLKHLYLSLSDNPILIDGATKVHTFQLLMISYVICFQDTIFFVGFGLWVLIFTSHFMLWSVGLNLWVGLLLCFTMDSRNWVWFEFVMRDHAWS